MLTRFRIKRDFRVFSRYLSDTPSDNNPKNNQKNVESQNKKEDAQDNLTSSKESAQSQTEKIQALLKSMMTAKPVISEEEYQERFTVAPDRRRKKKRDEIEVKTEQIEESITKAAGKVAEAIGGDVKQTESELLSKVLGKINQTSTSLSDLIIGMKVDRKHETDGFKSETRGEQVKRTVRKATTEAQTNTRYTQRKSQTFATKTPRTSLPQATQVDIFGGEALGIFTSKEVNYGTKLEVWEDLQERELMLATSQPPVNYFQKMILWTEQGKVWKFPINNEQGMEEEQNVHFSEHIFLDQHLEDWCPRKGPIRHFMELVCVGLSKNAFYTAQEKKDHILWYKEYFESKKDLLTEVGAWEVPSSTHKEVST